MLMHSGTSFRPVTRFTLDSLRSTIFEMLEFRYGSILPFDCSRFHRVQSNIAPVTALPGTTGHGPFVILRDGAFRHHDFDLPFSQGTVVVVTNITKRIQGCWDPDDFIALYGSERVSPIDCATGKTVRTMSVGEFFRLLKDEDVSRGRLKLKVC